MNAPAESTAPMADAAARRALKEELARINVRVHQPDDPPLFTREPVSAMVPVHWRWRDLLPALERIGKAIDIGSGGQRRTLRLTNPGLPFGTTPSIWASIQYILPGEIAEAHRHTANAFRFIMHGKGATSTVEGECYPMNEGDLVLTPTGLYHDHQHHGDAPMIWLDILDISLVRSLNACFFEPYPTPTQPIDVVPPDRSYRQFGSGLMRPPGPPMANPPNPLLAYPRAQARAALEQAAGLPADPCDDVILEYQNPLTGGPTMPTQSMTLQTLRRGFQGRARRHTGSKVYYVIEGSGASKVGDEVFEWDAGDFFVVPPWTWHAHSQRGAADAVLFQVNDTPTLRAFGWHREEIAAA